MLLRVPPLRQVIGAWLESLKRRTGAVETFDRYKDFLTRERERENRHKENVIIIFVRGLVRFRLELREIVRQKRSDDEGEHQTRATVRRVLFLFLILASLPRTRG